MYALYIGSYGYKDNYLQNERIWILVFVPKHCTNLECKILMCKLSSSIFKDFKYYANLTNKTNYMYFSFISDVCPC